MKMKRLAPSLVLAAGLLLGGACDAAREADRQDLSTTDPDATLPVMSDSTAPPAQPGAPATATHTGDTTGTMGDDSGFDPATTPVRPDTAATSTR